MDPTDPHAHPSHPIETPVPAESESCPVTPWWRNWKVMLPLWLGIGGLIWLGFYFNVDHRVIAGGVVVIGVLSNAFAWLVGIISLVPIIGPLIVKV